jgi:D-serine deaminase-like pyridoxal phosphate-dependent protein
VSECLQRRRGTIVSGGSTPSAHHTLFFPDTTEVRFGTYALNDSGMIALGIAQPDDCALSVLVTVTSKAGDRLIIDGGTSTFADYQTRLVGGFGRVMGQPWTVTGLGDDRGSIMARGNTVRVGEKLAIIPASVSKTLNLHSEVAYGRAGRVDGFWRLAARGCLQ